MKQPSPFMHSVAFIFAGVSLAVAMGTTYLTAQYFMHDYVIKTVAVGGILIAVQVAQWAGVVAMATIASRSYEIYQKRLEGQDND